MSLRPMWVSLSVQGQPFWFFFKIPKQYTSFKISKQYRNESKWVSPLARGWGGGRKTTKSAINMDDVETTHGTLTSECLYD